MFNLSKKAGVIPVVVFDGLSLPSKAGENERRRRLVSGNVLS